MEQLYYNGKIIMMSKQDFSEKVAETETVMVDLEGGCLMPAFIDEHSHMVMNGQMSLCADLTECMSFADIICALKDFMTARQGAGDAPVIGYGYDHNFLEERRHPNRVVLDEVSTEIPIMILHVSGHLACANSSALNLAGIDADTPDPEGGKDWSVC